MSHETSWGNRFVERVWYGQSRWRVPLLPLSWFFSLLVSVRQSVYRSGILTAVGVSKPVIVVGNIVSGGTGKTPVTIWLAAWLKEQGFRPGIVSRGYGGKVGDLPLHVSDDSDAGIVGDEPLLMARRAICPVVVHPDRVAAAATLIEMGCDVIIADDGLQHYRLQRDFEIAVVDGGRGVGNGRLLPAGPLREPVSRLQTVDQIMLQGKSDPLPPGQGLADRPHTHFELDVSGVHDLRGTGSTELRAFRNRTVHAVAAIGNPRRFFHLLEAHGVHVIPHAFSDHAKLKPSELQFDDGLDVVMTEKDAVKLAGPVPPNWWYVSVDLKLCDTATPAWLMRLTAELKTAATREP